jgi:hypothetical protein
MWSRVFGKTFLGKGYSYRILCFYGSGLVQGESLPTHP